MTEQTPTPPVTPEVNNPPPANPNPTSPTPTTPPSSTETPPKTETTEKKEEAKPSLLNQKEEEKKEEAKPGAPEKYEAWKLPEGYEFSEEVATEVGAMFKEIGLTQEQGQKLVDYYAKSTLEAAEAPVNLWLDKQEEWQNEIKNDPKIGSKLPVVKASIAKMVDGLGDTKLADSFREAMDYTGAGNNPAFVRLMYALAQKYGEGTHVSGEKPGPDGQKSPTKPGGPGAGALYPNLA